MSLVKAILLLFSISAALGSLNAWALPNDKEYPIRIQASEARLDEEQGAATYKGNVVITQGSMKLTGDRVTVTRNKVGKIDVVTSVGNLAYFEQLQRPTDPKPVQGYAVTIQYHAPQNLIVLIDRAKVVNDGNTTEGEKIVYDIVNKVATAGRANGSSLTTPRPRINMILQPKNRTD